MTDFSTFTSAALAIAVLASFALGWGGIKTMRRGEADRRRGALMLIAAAVLLANVVIATI